MRNIILLHGAIGASDQLQPLSEELSKQNFNVYSFSFSGHGKMPFQKDFGIEQFSRELKNFIEENDLDQPHVFGYSMGGYVALYLASHYSLLLGKIITLGTKFDWTKEIAEKEIKQLNPKTISEKVPKFADALMNRHGESWELLLQRTAEMMISLGNNNILNANQLSIIENEINIGLADTDNMVTLEETNFVSNQLKNAGRFTLSQTKHPIETVNVSLLAKIIKDFVDSKAD